MIKFRASVSQQAPVAMGTPRGIPTPGLVSLERPPKEGTSELKPVKLVGISQVRGGDWHLQNPKGEPKVLEAQGKFGEKKEVKLVK